MTFTLSSGKQVNELRAYEKGLILDGFMPEAVQKVWDFRTENANNPEACSLQDAKELVNHFILESGFDESMLRK